MRCARSPASAMTGPRASVQERTCADRNPELPHVRSFAVEGRGLEHSQPWEGGALLARGGALTRRLPRVA